MECSLFLKMLRFGELRVCLIVHSNHGQQKARKMYRKYEKSYVMFVDLKSYSGPSGILGSGEKQNTALAGARGRENCCTFQNMQGISI